jgi:hypothetical protein
MRIAVSLLVGAGAVLFLFGALAPEPGATGASGLAAGDRYLFLPARQNLWVVDQKKDAIMFFKFPDNEDRPIQRSRRSFPIDRSRFPREHTRFLLSMRNLTSLLWIVNGQTGEVQVIRYGRDGTFDAEFHLPAGQQFE